MFSKAPVVVKVEVEPGAKNAGEPAQGTGARSSREMGNDLLHAPTPTQRLEPPPAIVEQGQVGSESGTLDVGSGP